MTHGEKKCETFAGYGSLLNGRRTVRAGWFRTLRYVMALCTYCKTETFRYEGGDIPVCIECSDAAKSNCRVPREEHEIRKILHQEFVTAAESARDATASFDAVVNEIPSRLPHPDAVQRIHNASRAVSAARIQMMKAHNRLNDYLNRRVVPEDLKRSG